MPALPSARGPLSDGLLDLLRDAPPGSPGDLPPLHALPDDPLADDDLQLALYLCYELHYRGFDGVDERWEWDPGLLALRAGLEAAFEAALHAAVPSPAAPADPGAMDLALRAIADADDGPSLSRFVQGAGDARAGPRVRSCTARPTSSRRPTRTRGRSRG